MIFIDTGAFIARHLARDQHHRKATALWGKLERSGLRCLTTELVVSETATLLARWASPGFAVERVRALYQSEVLSIHRAEPSDDLAALDLMLKYQDQAIGFTDCVSFVLMQKAGIHRAFTLDRRFRVAGFEPWA